MAAESAAYIFRLFFMDFTVGFTSSQHHNRGNRGKCRPTKVQFYEKSIPYFSTGCLETLYLLGFVLCLSLIFEQGADKLRPAAHIVLGEDIAHMELDRAFTDRHGCGNFLIGLAGKNEGKHFVFPFRQGV